MGAAKPPASTFAPIDGGRVRGLGAGFKALQRLHAVAVGVCPCAAARAAARGVGGARAGAHRLRRPRPPVPTARSWQCARIASCARPLGFRV